MTTNLHFVKDLARHDAQGLGSGRPGAFAALMNEHWEHKKRRSPNMSSGRINEAYDLARNKRRPGRQAHRRRRRRLPHVSTPTDKTRCVRQAMREIGMEELRFRFDFEGTKLMIEH